MLLAVVVETTHKKAVYNKESLGHCDSEVIESIFFAELLDMCLVLQLTYKGFVTSVQSTS